MYKYAVIDIETTGLNRFKDEITYIGVELHKDIKQKGRKTYIFDYSSIEDRHKFAYLVKKMKNCKVRTVFQNGKFDTLFIEVKMGIKLPISEDVMLMGTAYDLSDKHG